MKVLLLKFRRGLLVVGRFPGSQHLFQGVCVLATLVSLNQGAVLGNNDTAEGCDDCLF